MGVGEEKLVAMALRMGISGVLMDRKGLSTMGKMTGTDLETASSRSAMMGAGQVIAILDTEEYSPHNSAGAEDDSKALEVTFNKESVSVKIPRMNSDGHYRRILNQLLRLQREHSPSAWTFDLSELESLPIALASILLGFRGQTRSHGCEVRFYPPGKATTASRISLQAPYYS